MENGDVEPSPIKREMWDLLTQNFVRKKSHGKISLVSIADSYRSRKDVFRLFISIQIYRSHVPAIPRSRKC